MTPRSLLGHLLAWTFGALALVWAAFIVAGLRTGVHEADELTDGHLASTAALLSSQRSNEFVGMREVAPPSEDLKRHDYQQSLSVVVWDGQGQVLSRIGEAPLPPFDPGEGFQTLRLGPQGVPWRTFARWDSPARQRHLMVLLSIEERDDLAWDIARQVAEPGFWLLPVIALALGMAIRRGLRPLGRLSAEVAALDIQAGEPLRRDHRHEEFQAVVESINALIVRYQAAIANERQLAGELAHELRTPLASLALHAQALQGAMPSGERDKTVARLAADALRAGQVLQHLLTLARASHAELAEAAVSFDLVPLAAEVLADYAQVSLDGGHDLALTGSASYVLAGHPVLIGITLRNLVENALGHAPAGSVVEIEINASAQYLQVTNELSMEGPGHVSGAASLSRLGLGFGHRVIDKVAAIHGATFTDIPAGEKMRRYRIAFGKD